MNLSELAGEQDILLGMEADRKRAALGGMAAQLGKKVDRTQGAVLAALLGRERLGSTAVGHGVAIPHAQLDGISTPAAVVATLQRPVPFGSPDDEPVDLLLALLWPKSDAKGFVPALRHVWRLMRRAGLPGLLRQSRTPAEAHDWIKSFEQGAWADLADSAARPDERACRTRSGATTITGSAGSPWRLLAVTGPHF